MLEPNRTRGPVQTEGGRLQPLRRRLAAWVADGVAPPGLAPAAVAAAHLRVSGRPAARDPLRRGYRVYSADELRAALIELGGRSPRPAPPPPPPLDPLPLIWQAAVQRAQVLPSGRMLLTCQARLIALHERGPLVVAVVGTAPQWLPLIEARRAAVSRALADTLGRPVALQLRGVGQ